MTPIEHYRRAARYVRREATTTAAATRPPSTAGILALCALAVPCGALVVSGDVRLLLTCLACSALGFVAGVVLAAEAEGVSR